MTFDAVLYRTWALGLSIPASLRLRADEGIQ